tara:strand:- start:486 stop:1505 length:1020 start_codon:yes stop_codon:yes gene_type:complete
MAKLHEQPAWFWELLESQKQEEGQSFTLNGSEMRMVGGIPRSESFLSSHQTQTRDAFGFKWAKRDTFENKVADELKVWLAEKYGNILEEGWFQIDGESKLVLDAGCGASLSGLSFFEDHADRIKYLGVDVSDAVETASIRMSERGFDAAFMQADLMHLPFGRDTFDLIFSEGVLHHTDSTRQALSKLATHLKPGGRIIFYVYRKKGPIREFTDDYIRDKVQGENPEDVWEELKSLTKLGKLLGELEIEIEIPEAIDILEIPAGRINLQRLFYWHVCKTYYDPGMTLDEMNHLNYDWFAPKNAHRQKIEDVREWCSELDLVIERERVEDAGISIVAVKSI